MNGSNLSVVMPVNNEALSTLGRSVKCEEVYLRAYDTVADAGAGLKR